MGARYAVGFALLAALVALGLGVVRLRTGARPGVRALAARTHRAVGMVAIAVLVVFAVTAIRLLTS